MTRQPPRSGIAIFLTLLVALAGCHPQQPFYFHEDGDLSHYVGVATDIEYPDVCNPTLDDVRNAQPPLTLENPFEDPEKVWDLGLEEAVKHALENSKVMRSLGGVAFGPSGAQGNPESLLNVGDSDGLTTIYSPAESETDARFGVESALSAFDAQFSTSAFWEKNDQPQNVLPGDVFERFRPPAFQQDLGTFQAQISKLNATGGQTAIRHNVQYEQNNVGFRGFPSDWTVNIEGEIRQPVLRGFGTTFNRISGPGSVPGFYNGVMIARVRTDISLTNFEASVRNVVNDVERAYWNLYFAYRLLDAAIEGRDSALETWREVRAKYDTGGKGGSAQEEAQAREQYFTFRSAAEQALSNLYKTETLLRYIMGLGPTDGRLIRPSDEPTTAKVDFDWYEIHCESLARSVELRKQRWRIKQREMELIAAKNWLLPQLDLVGRYRWRGMGDDLLNSSGNPDFDLAGDTAETAFRKRFDNAYTNMFDGDFQEWQLGFEFSLPFGFRREMAGVRNAQIKLARDRAVLQEQELELCHSLSDAIRNLEQQYAVAQSNYNRLAAAKREVEAVQAAYETGTFTLDLVLDAQRRRAEAERDYYRALVDYNLAVTQVHFRKGSLLEYNGVYLAEGPWPQKAYFDAHRRARQRDASYYLDYGSSRPQVVSRGPYAQHAGAATGPGGGPLFGSADGTPTLAPPKPSADGGEVPVEELPAPEPLPLDGADDAMVPEFNLHPEAVDSARTAPPAAGSPRFAASRKRAASGSSPAGPKTRDLGDLNLHALAVKPAAGRSEADAERSASGVRPASFDEALPAEIRASSEPGSGDGWHRAARSLSTHHEPVASRPSAEAAGDASGWKGIDR